MKVKYTYKNNIKLAGHTVRGEGQYHIIDTKGNPIVSNRCRYLDYELATFFIDWINERKEMPPWMNEILALVDEQEK